LTGTACFRLTLKLTRGLDIVARACSVFLQLVGIVRKSTSPRR
jgi:hypothetical protein